MTTDTMRRLCLLSLALGLTACPGRLEDPDRFLDASVDCTRDYIENELFVSTCGGSGCHGPTNPGGSLDLVSSGVETRLLGASTCAGHPLKTFMLEKLNPNPPCTGSQMPLGLTPLSSAQKACLSSYLSALGTDGGADAGRPPTVASTIVFSDSSPVAGQVFSLFIIASDPDGDPLTYTWTQTSPANQGTFGVADGGSITWYAPITTADTSTSFSVTVSDGHSAGETRTGTVTVGAPKLGDVYTSLFQPVCTGCHGGAGSLTFGTTSAAAWSATVDAGHHRGAACNDAGVTRLVVPGDPAHSLLSWKVGGVDAGLPAGGQCGAQMPKGGAPLPPSTRIMVDSWILAGAKNN